MHPVPSVQLKPPPASSLRRRGGEHPLEEQEIQLHAESNERPYIPADHQLPAPPSSASAAPKRRAWVRVVVWLALILVFALIFLLVIRHRQKPAGSAPRRGPGQGTAAVNPVTAERGDIGVYLDAIGTVTPVYTASITSEVSGIVTAVHFREGQMVRKGDPLIDIDSRQYRATLLQAQGLLQRDEGVLAQATMDLGRYRDAWNRNAIPKQTLDDQEKIVAQDEGTVKNDEGTVQYDEVQVGFTHIVAPITGRVGLRLVDPGNVVPANGTTPLAVVTQIQPITVVFTIAEDSINQVSAPLRAGKKLVVDAYDRTDQHKIASGTLLTLDNQIDTTTGTVKARAQFTNANASLFPNQFVNTRLLVNTLHNATLIPTSAVQHNGQAAFVYVITDNVAHTRTIRQGVTDGLITEVQGINPGDVLANSSFEKLQDNAKVATSNRPQPKTSSNSGSGAP